MAVLKSHSIHVHLQLNDNVRSSDNDKPQQHRLLGRSFVKETHGMFFLKGTNVHLTS